MADAIVLIDDLFFQAKLLETAKLTGIAPQPVATGEQLLKAAAANPAALVIVDLNARQGSLDAVEQLCKENLEPGVRSNGPGRDASIQVHTKSRGDIARSEIVTSPAPTCPAHRKRARNFVLTMVFAA